MHTVQQTITTLRRRMFLHTASAGVAGTAVVALGYGLLALFLESWALFGPTGRVVLWAIWIVTVGVAVWFVILLPIRRLPDGRQTARAIEKANPELKERVAAAHDFLLRGVSKGESAELANEVIAEADRSFQDIDLSPLVSRRSLFKWSAALFVVLSMYAGVWTVFGESVGPAWSRFTSPLTSFVPAPSIELMVLPGSVSVVKGDSVLVLIKASGDIPATAELRTRRAGTTTWHVDHLALTSGSAEHMLKPVLDSFEYQVRVADVHSPEYRITAIDPPQVRRLWISLKPPRYTGLPRLELEPGEGNIEALLGTRANISLVSNKPLTQVMAIFASGDTVNGITSAEGGDISFSLRRRDRYRLLLIDEDGYRNPDPIEYEIVAIPDEYPTIRLLEPERDIDLNDTFMVNLLIEASDDFGFSSMALRYTGPQGREVEIQIPLRGISKGHLMTRYVWDLGDMDLLPNDRVSYKILVWDNDRILGPKIAESGIFTVRFPSVEEIFAESIEAQQEQVAEGEELLDKTRGLRESMEQMRRELLKSQDMNWEQKQKAENSLEEQQETLQDIEEMVEALEEAIEKLEEHDVLSSETMEKMLQIRELMRELIPPELSQKIQEMMSKLQDNVSPEEMAEAMQQLSQDQRSLEERLERTLELLKRAQDEQRMDAMAKAMEQVADRQKRIAEEMNENSGDELSRGQKELSEATERLQEQMRELAENSDSVPSDSLKQLADQMDEDRLSARMDELSRQLSQDRKGPAQQEQASNLAQKMESVASKMRKMAQDMKAGQKSEDLALLRRITADMVELSFMQESAWSATAEGSGMGQLNDMAENQSDLIQSANRIAGRLVQAGKEMAHLPVESIRSVGLAVNKMQLAVAQVAERRPDVNIMGQNQFGAMGDLNDAAIALMAALSQASKQQQSGGSSLESLMQQLEAMTGQQQSMEGMMQPFSGRMPGSLSSEERAALAAMAAEQEALRKSLEELQRQLDQFKQALGNLGDTEADMREQEKAFRRGQIDGRTLDRQRRIVRRLLDAQRSLNTQDMGRRREGHTAKLFRTVNPGELPDDLGERRMLLREMMQRAMRADYPQEYRDLIRRYYESLMQIELETELP